MKRKKPIMAIDGPVSSGKSTVAKLVAEKLGFCYIDTGAMYRVITLKSLKNKIDLKDEKSLIKMAKNTKIKFKEGKKLKVFMDGTEVTDEIRNPLVSKNTSDIADSVGVKKILIKLQQKMGKNGGVVLEGRDIGSLVFPDAEFKFYIDASRDKRAKRRYKELLNKGMKQDFETVRQDLTKRDERDVNRSFGALKLVKDAKKIDTTNLNIDEVVNIIVNEVKKGVSK
ncbi:MAG: (d)CMP kinase [Candidatus Firestonebacteria bacterium]